MRIAACLVLASAFAAPVFIFAVPTALGTQNKSSAPHSASAAVQELFKQFGLFGRWAIDCKEPARSDNPHVRISRSDSETVLEDHDLGPDYAVNHYRVLSAERISRARLSVDVLFQPGTESEERQKLIFLVRDGTRRTLFNQPADGRARVKDGVALAGGEKTPLLAKCGER